MSNTTNAISAEILIEPCSPHRSTANASDNFAQTLATIPLFAPWSSTPPIPFNSQPPNTNNSGITTQASTNRRHDGRRRSPS